MRSQFISAGSFQTPNYLAPSGWAQHIPFAFWLIENLRPKTIVELGVHYGVSYFAFCQAVKNNEINSVCYAVDTWEGDSHAGFYDNSVFDQVRDYNAANYSGFSYLLRMDFDKAVSCFEDGSIDLLHIDGLHTYEAVKKDFNNWQPKLSKSGIVLFHDISVKGNDFGVFKLWEELSAKAPSFSFVHGFGLGVLAAGTEISQSISFLFDKKLPDHIIYEIRNTYHRLGSSFSDQLIIKEQESRIAECVTEGELLRQQKEEMYKEIVQLGEWGTNSSKEVDDLRLLINEKNNTLVKNEEIVGEYKKALQENSIILGQKQEYIQRIEIENKSLEEEKNKAVSEVVELSDKISRINQQLDDKKNSIYRLESEKKNFEQRLDHIYGSQGWKLLQVYYKIKGKLLPENSKRYKYLKKTFNRLRSKNEENYDAGSTGNIRKKIISNSQSGTANESQTVFEKIEFKSFQLPDVSIIIPVFNGWAMTYKCLKSIRENSIETTYEVIVADDGATDETKNIKNYIKDITVVRNPQNLGFLDNCNNAAKSAKGRFIVFLNNDTEVLPGWLSSLVELMGKDRSIGMTGSKLVYPDGKLQEAGGIIWKDGSAWNFGHNQSPDLPEFNYVKEADYISGACILIRTDLWKEIGGFDRRYAPAYCEDSDLAFEVRKRGFKVVYQPLSEIIHFEGYSHGTDETGDSIKANQKLNNEKFREKWKDVLSKEHFENGENVFWARDRSRYKKTILVIDHYVPHFDKDAGSKTVFQYLKLFVSMNYNVKFIGDNFFSHEPYTTALQQMGIEVLCGPWYSNNWQEWMKRHHDKIDLVLLNRPHISIKYIDFIRVNTNAQILYYGHDLHFVRMLKQYEIEKKEEILNEAQKWKQIEISLFNKSDIVLAPGEKEMDLIKKLGVVTPVYPVKPYIFNSVASPVSGFSDRKDILFVGGFSHLPNVDAVIWFVREIWPLVKQEIEGARFMIVGSTVSAEITALAGQDIEVVGFLSESDLQKLYAKIKLVVIPLRYGAGVKGKTVEAMYNGIPLVSTSFGIEGLPGNTSFILPRDNAIGFAEEIIRLYNAPDEILTDLSNKETNYINDHFHFDMVKLEMADIMQRLKGKN